MPGAGLSRGRSGKVPLGKPAFQPYWGKPAVRNDRGDRGNVGIIRSPIRASILPDLRLRTVGGVDGSGGESKRLDQLAAADLAGFKLVELLCGESLHGGLPQFPVPWRNGSSSARLAN